MLARIVTGVEPSSSPASAARGPVHPSGRTSPWPPDFLILGAQKCGTTSLATSLRSHPDVFVPRLKEAHHFGSVDDADVGGEAYRRFFSGWDGQRLVGEATPGYLFRPESARQICRFLPEVKGIVLLRDPVDRAYSAYWNGRRIGRVAQGFSEAIDTELQDGHLSRGWFDDLVARGHYVEQLQRFFDAGFDRERLLVAFFEEMVADEDAVLRDVQVFLGVEVRPLGLPHENRSRRSWLPSRVRSALSPHFRTRWARSVEHLTRRSWDPPPMDEADRARLSEHFRPWNERLAEMLGRELPGWGR